MFNKQYSGYNFGMSRLGRHGWVHHLVAIIYVVVLGLARGIVWLAVGMVGAVVWWIVPSPFNLVIGLPLVLGSVGLLVNTVWDKILVVFSDKFNHGMCPVCNA